MVARNVPAKRTRARVQRDTPTAQIHTFLPAVDHVFPAFVFDNVVGDLPNITILDADALAALSDVSRLLGEALADVRHKATSLRLNESLREAAEIAVNTGWADSFTALVEQGLATRLAQVVSHTAEQAALDAHYAEHPDARPDLWEIAVAAARIDASPLAEHPELIRRAAEALGDHADVDRVLVWAAGALAAAE